MCCLLRIQFILFINMHKIILNKICAYQHSCFFHCIHIQNSQRKPLNLRPLCKHLWFSNFLFEFPSNNFMSSLVFKVLPSWFSYKTNLNNELVFKLWMFKVSNHDIPISLAWELYQRVIFLLKKCTTLIITTWDKIILPTT
jgi:hypothetical protein